MDQIKSAIAKTNSMDLSSELQDYACVSLLLRMQNEQLELAFIRRAENPNDGWAGQLAFPGGRRDPSDTSDLITAIRETHEEVGLALTAENCLGRLHDVQARQKQKMHAFFIRSFVFFVDQSQTPKLEPTEVADFFWMPLAYFLNPAVHTVHSMTIQSQTLKLPAIQFKTGPPLWGLTYIMLTDFVDRLYVNQTQIQNLDFTKILDLSFWRKYI